MLDKKITVSNPLNYYSELGFKIFPSHYKTRTGCSCKKANRCKNPGKHPAIQGYQHLASSQFKNLTTHKSLFGSKFRNYDIGASTGLEFFVIDSDTGELEDLPRTWKSKSPNRGFHYFYKVPHGTQIRNIRELFPGVDIKGLGGIVILPSEVNNREWINYPHETDLADAPAYILEAIENHEEEREKVYSKILGGFDFSSEVIEEGARNDTLFRYGCYLRSLSFEYEGILSQLAIVNENRCDPPLGVVELEDISNSACNYSLDQDLTELLTLFREALFGIQWKGKAGKSDRSILVTLLTENEERYEVILEGLEVSISYRKIAEKTGLNKKSIYTRINEASYLQKGKPSNGNKSGTVIISHSLLKCVPATTLTNNKEGEMVSVVAMTHTLRFNSMRWGNLGKSAVLVLEILLEGSHQRKDLEERLGYSQGGASGILKKLRKKGLIQANRGVYSLVDDFDKRIQPLIEENSKDIEQMKKVHEADRKHYGIRLEALRRAWEDEAAIQKTAEEDNGSIYYLKVMMNQEARYHRVRLNMLDHYQQLKSGGISEKIRNW